jgi:hypothetical protein
MRRSKDLTPLGHARVYRDRAGELKVDTDTLRRSSFAGSERADFGDDYGDDYGDDDLGDDDYGDDDYGDDDLGDDDLGDDDLGDDDLGDDDLGDDDLGDDETGEELGDDFAGPRRRRRKQRRLARRKSRLSRRMARVDSKMGNRSKRRSKMRWGMTAVGGVDTVSEEGAATVKVRLQHDFRAHDVTFTGSASGATVTSIFFGDRVVWSNSDGIDVSVFATNSFMRGLLRGQSLRAGLDITANGNMPGAGTFSVTIIGQKPIGRR